MSASTLDDSTRQRIAEELRAGRKISAIKMYREATRSSLAEAKAAVEAMPLPAGSESGSGSSPPDLLVVEEHLRAGRKIDAIKEYRRRTGVGLAEAKEAVEAMASGRGSFTETVPASPAVETRSGCFTSSAVLLASFLALYWWW